MVAVVAAEEVLVIHFGRFPVGVGENWDTMCLVSRDGGKYLRL